LLKTIATISLVLSILSALAILADIVLGGRRQRMRVMEAVWPITALYFGPFGLWAYWSIGRPGAMPDRRHCGSGSSSSGKTHGRGHRQKPMWQTTFVSTCHCGGGCTLGDIAGEWLVFLIGVTIAGAALWPELVADFALAYLLGIAFQYFAIVPMRNLSPHEGLISAAKADTLSLLAFEVGLFGWMILMRFVLFDPPLHPDDPVYWLMMQLGMVIGFATSYPANRWLVRRGIKEAM
jgi:hypothetical protein